MILICSGLHIRIDRIQKSKGSIMDNVSISRDDLKDIEGRELSETSRNNTLINHVEGVITLIRSILRIIQRIHNVKIV